MGQGKHLVDIHGRALREELVELLSIVRDPAAQLHHPRLCQAWPCASASCATSARGPSSPGKHRL